MKNNSLPTVSIVIVTYNCAQNLRECLSRINLQDYPKEKIEILVIDGGSTDDTLIVARSFGANVLYGGFRDNSEARRGIGLLQAKNEIIAYIDSDIFLPHPHWLREMIEPLIENGDLVATQPLRYEYQRTDSLLNRYFSLLGVHDPVAYYLNKRDRFSWAESRWNLFGSAQDAGRYYVVKFNCFRLPPLGCNGFVARRAEMLECTLPNPKNIPLFTHSDAVYDLVNKGRNTFGFVKNTVIHSTSSGSVWKFIKRRMVYTETFHFRDVPRRYKVYDSKSLRDNFNLVKYIVYSLTVVKPFYDSFRGFLKIRDIAWFVHPAMCLVMLFAYGIVTVKHIFKAYLGYWIARKTEII